MRNSNRVLTRAMIADNVWDYDFPNVTNVIDVHIRWLRHKLDDPYPGRVLQTVRGVGYRLIGET
jgi:DNA-binding response OmpR family regulator